MKINSIQGKGEIIDDYLTNMQGLINLLDEEIPMLDQLD